jgi:serine/threonine protein kinase
MPMTPEFAVGGILRRRYRLQSKIGLGGMAAVFLARDEVLHRDVAVKIFQASATDQEDIAQQELEVRILAGLGHHSVVTILDAGVDRTNPLEPHLFLVMELVGGSDLARRLEKGALSPRRAAELGYDLAEGLEYIHHHGVVHRDIKPANILLVDYGREDSRPRAKLTDFGIARLTESGRVTHAGLTTGTAAYLSPEQARGNQVGPASDVYSLGLVLLECLTGELAFPGTPMQSAVARLVDDPVIPGHLSPAWRELLSAMTRRAPGDRPPVHDVILSLREIFITEVGRHRPVDPAIVPANESARMAAVRRYQLLDTPPDGAFDRITALAARVVKAPVAIVSVVDHDRIWFKSHHGLDIDEIGRDSGLCASAILHDGPWVVEGARTDPRTLLNPLVASDFGLQFYAGVPLTTHDGYNLGTLCVLDFEPRTISDDQLATLEDLAAMVMSELELRRESLRLHGTVTAP